MVSVNIAHETVFCKSTRRHAVTWRVGNGGLSPVRPANLRTGQSALVCPVQAQAPVIEQVSLPAGTDEA
jgi:hypothetical protein